MMTIWLSFQSKTYYLSLIYNKDYVFSDEGLCFFRRRAARRFGRKHVGASKKRSMFTWALDVNHESLSAKFQNIFLNKCLLICTIFSLLQHEYFQSNRKNPLFQYVCNLNSKFHNKKMQACKILEFELEKLFSVTKLQQTGPYQVQTTMKILNETYKCQFFVFTGYTGKQKLSYLYPSKYDDSLFPVYLYMPHSANDHFIYIRNLNSYFRANRMTCFECKKSFSTFGYRHLCPQRSTCFACRRFFSSNSTFLHEKMEKQFCNKNITEEKEFLCSTCNVTVYSNHCLKGHKLLCNGKGHFGFKCLTCLKFFYASKSENSHTLKQNHNCSDLGMCKICYKPRELDHICKLSKCKIPKSHNRLAFLYLEVAKLEDFSLDPLFALIYLEQGQRGCFEKYLISDFDFNFDTKNETYNFQYFLPSTKFTDFENLTIKLKSKVSEDFSSKICKLANLEDFYSKFLLFIISSTNTTFICQDLDGTKMVSTFTPTPALLFSSQVSSGLA